MLNARERAAVNGWTTYEGRACRHCGSTTRYVSTSNCATCQRRRSSRNHHRIKELRRQAAEAEGAE